MRFLPALLSISRMLAAVGHRFEAGNFGAAAAMGSRCGVAVTPARLEIIIALELA
jgi:hypothetical protein